MSRPQESELLRLQAFHLFGTLAKVVRISKKHLFKEEVRRAWVPLLLHCQDPCPDTAQVRRSPGFGPQSRGCSSQKGKCFLGPLAQPPIGSPTTPSPVHTVGQGGRRRRSGSWAVRE